MNERQRIRAMSALALAYERVGRKEIAKACNVTVNTTYGWDVVPPLHVLVVQEVSGVPAMWLRPDIYPGIDLESE
jgi:hypothetical protein